MNENRVLQNVPVGMGRIYRGPYTQIWLCMSVVPEPHPIRPKRITAFRKQEQRAARRREIIRHILQAVFVIGTLITWAAAVMLLFWMVK